MKTILAQLRHTLLDYRGHSVQLQQILLSYITPCSATGHPAQLQQILLSYNTPCSATEHPAQLQKILLNHITPCSATGHPAQLQQILLSYITPCSVTGHLARLQDTLLNYSKSCTVEKLLIWKSFLNHAWACEDHSHLWFHKFWWNHLWCSKGRLWHAEIDFINWSSVISIDFSNYVFF